MPYRPFEDQNCSIAAALAVVGERWTLLVMREVLLGNRRFQEIRRNTGVAPNILSDRLATLVEQGLLRRRPCREQPHSYEYHPTAKGADLGPVLIALLQWGDKHAGGPDGPRRVIVHSACHHDAHPRLQCTHCGEPLRTTEIEVRPGPGAAASLGQAA
jgi:DNA-binding HxlR family transcriptional regulator